MAGAREILFDSVKALERQTAGFHILSPFVCSTAPKEHVLYEILGKVLDLVGADAGTIVLADETAGIFDFVTLRWTNLPALQITAKEKALRLFRVPLTEGIIGQVYRSGEPVILPDVSKSQTFRKDMADAVDYHVHTLLAAPIRADNRTVGVLELFNKTPRGTFSAQDMELAVGLARVIGLVLESRRLHQIPVEGVPSAAPPAPTEEILEARRAARDAQAQLKETQTLLETAMQTRDQCVRRVQELTEEMEKLKAATEAATPPERMLKLLHSVEPIAFSLSLETVIRHFAELAARLVNARALRIFLWDEKREVFSLGYSTVPAGESPALSFKKGEGIAGHAGGGGAWLNVEDAAQDNRFSKAVDEAPGIAARSVLAGPLIRHQRLVGVLHAVNHKEERPFSGEEAAALEGLALVGAEALEKVLAHRDLREAARSILNVLTSGPSGPRPLDAALKEIERCSGQRFDPASVEQLLRLDGAGRLPS